MKTEFTLTFDDFLEYHNYRLQLKESMMAGAIAFVGLALIALGYILLRQGCEGMVAGLVLFAGLATTAAAVPVGLFSSFLRRRGIDRRKATIKKEFDRFYEGPREFEADDTGWTFGFKGAQDIRLWANLSWFREEQQTFIMADELAVYLLPKPILKEEFEQLRELCVRSLALPGEIHSIALIPSLGDFLAASFSHNWQKHRATMVALYAVGLLSIIFLWLVLIDAWPVLRLPAALLLPLLVPCLEAAYHWMQFRKGRWRSQFDIADISVDRICLRKGTLDSTTSMFRLTRSRIVEVRENVRVFIVYAFADRPYVIPKSGIPWDKMAEVRKSLLSVGK